MSPLASSFIDYMACMTPDLYEARLDTIDFWAPDEAPPTIAFADLGVRVVDAFNAVGAAANKAVFRAMEWAFAVRDIELTILVANGLVNGIVDRALEIGMWNDIGPMFGPLAARHAHSWFLFRTRSLAQVIDSESRAHRWN